MTYKWTKSNYKYFDYLIRVDSDVYPNIQLIILYINLITIKKRVVYGFYYPPMKTNRDRNNKNYIPNYIYSSSLVPEFVAGNFYIFPKFYGWIEFVNRISKIRSKLIYREDIQMGIFFKIYNISVVRINFYYKRKILFKKCSNYQLSLALHGVKYNNMLFIYNKCS